MSEPKSSLLPTLFAWSSTSPLLLRKFYQVPIK